MANKKRKQDNDEGEELNHSASDSDAPPKKSEATTSRRKVSPKPKTAKKPKFEYSEDESPPSHEESKKQAVKVLKNAEGEKYVNLGKKKRAAVRSFKGQVFVDIREYYGTDGDEKPGKKGISLQKEQWETLKNSISVIDSLFKEQGQK